MNTKYSPFGTLPRPRALTAAIASTLIAGSLQAATITVTSLQEGSVSGQCTLRSALLAASSNSAFDACTAGQPGPDLIQFHPGLSGTVQLIANTATPGAGAYYDGSTLPIGESVTIDGDNRITVRGTGNAPVFYAKYNQLWEADAVTVTGLTITNGGGLRGGGIVSRARALNVVDTTLSNSVVSEGGGAIWHQSSSMFSSLSLTSSNVINNAAGGYAGKGGGVAAVMAYGSVIVTDSTFENNRADYGFGGGGLSVQIDNLANLIVQNSHFLYNSVGAGPGGGIRANLNYATVSISGNWFEGNDAATFGGGLYLREDRSITQRAEISLPLNTFIMNSAGLGGGGASLMVLNGNAGTPANPVKFIDLTSNFLWANATDGRGGGLWIRAGDTVDVALSSTTISSNFASFGGGGLYLDGEQASFSVGSSDIQLNMATSNGAKGGGLLAYLDDSDLHLSAVSSNYNYNNGSISSNGGGAHIRATNSELTIEGSGFIGNQARGCGGGLDISGQPSLVSIGGSRFVNNSAYVCGGGINLLAPTLQNALVEVKYSEISTNVAAGNLVGGTLIGGGGMNVALGTGSLFRLHNSTISTNVAVHEGGGLSLNGDMTAEIKYSTWANNRTLDQGAGINNNATNCTIGNSILDGNSTYSAISQEIWGNVNCGVSNSLIAGASTSLFDNNGGNVLNQSALLAPLANNGGNGTHTHALMDGSPAIDAGSAGATVPTFDQRGSSFARVRGGAIDMGAYERFSDRIFRDRFSPP